MAYHKWSNPKLTLNGYKAILSCHVAQSSYFNRMVEKKIIWKIILTNPNDAMCQFFRLPRVNIFGVHYSRKCSCKCSCKNSSLYTYEISIFIFYKRNLHLSSTNSCRLQLVVIYNLSFVTMLIFSHCFIYN